MYDVIIVPFLPGAYEKEQGNLCGEGATQHQSSRIDDQGMPAV